MAKRFEPNEWSRYFHSDDLPGVEALHARFVDYQYALHTHDAYTIALVDRGAATFELEGRRHVAPAGSVFVIGPGRAHTGESASPDGYIYRVLYLSLNELADRLEISVTGADRTAQTVWPAAGFALPLRQIHNQLLSSDRDLEQQEGIWSALDRLAPLLSNASPSVDRVDHQAVRRACAYLHDHWNEPVSLTELAGHAGLSPYRLTRLFHSALGLPPSTYQRQIRVDQAKRFLRSGDGLADVAAACGFYDQAHLNRHFRRMTGVTPATYAR